VVILPSTAAATATVTIDGARVGVRGDNVERAVAAGMRQIVISAPGYRAERRTITVEAGRRSLVTVKLTRE
jgi:hypothetical protein